MHKKFMKPGMALLVSIPLILSGCGLSTASKPSNPSKKSNVHYVKPGDSLNQPKNKKKQDKKTSSKQTTSRKLFLVDKNGLVVPQTFQLPVPSGGGVAKQALQYLVKGGPITNLLPNGFQAVLPPGTEIGADLKGHTLTVNFSKQFKSYQPKLEKQILQSITWTATQFQNVDHVKIEVNGVALKKMPADGTPIGEKGLSRANGINEELGNVVDVTGTQPVTLYYPEQVGKNFYYVPVSTRVAVGKGKITAAVNELLNGPAAGSKLLNVFGNDVQLIGQPKIDTHNHVVTLNFNKNIYSDPKTHVISNKELDTILLSLTTQQGIKKVAIEVNGKSTAKSESGKALSKPVSRPENVNTVGL